MTQPLFVGPPPQPPKEPEHRQPAHVLHLLLTLLTAGLWAIIWVCVAANAAVDNRNDRRRYQDELDRYAQDYDEWQRRYQAVYGYRPQPAS